MKQKIIKTGVLSVVFVVAVIVFSMITNQGSTDMTTSMSSASFPTVSFQVEGYEVNPLVGYRQEMEIPMMRDGVTLLDEVGNVTLLIQAYEQVIEALTYEVYSLDGERQLSTHTVEAVEAQMKLAVGEAIAKGEEAVLKLTLQTEQEEAIHYYTRIKHPATYEAEESLDFVAELHENLLQHTNTNEVKQLMESHELGDNTTYERVTIHSDLEHLTWGQLHPQAEGEIQWRIEDIHEVYTAIQLKYQVLCVGEENEEELHNVTEYFRVRHADGEWYLLDYERTMNQVFDGTKQVLGSKGIQLGISEDEISYRATADGNVVAFVKERELWCYDQEEDTMSCVFSFVETGKEDVRNRNEQHDIRILSMDESGNMTFGVYGYMTRGTREGEVGAAIYYYRVKQHTVEEKLFISCNQNPDVVEEELGQLSYYNETTQELYVMLGGTLYRNRLGDGVQEVLVEELLEGQYVTTTDGHLVAYQVGDSLTTATEIVLRNLQSGKEQHLYAEEGTCIRPLGFVGDDFVYGVSKEKAKGTSVSGTKVSPMYQVLICDFEGNTLKSYKEKGIYIEDAFVEGKTITLKRLVKRDGVYQETSNDYITNHTEVQSEGIVLETYVTERKETQYRLAYGTTITDKKAKVLRPKQVLLERPMTMAYQSQEKALYAVYGKGELLERFASAGEAICYADEVDGIVVSSEQQVIWEMSNQHAWYRNFEIGGFYVQSGESSLEACMRQILRYENPSADTPKEIKNLTAAVKYLNKQDGIVGINLTGSSVEALRYFIGKGYPVIAMTGQTSGVLLIGYDALNVTYVNPLNGNIQTCTMERMEEMTKDSGNSYVGYMKNS